MALPLPLLFLLLTSSFLSLNLNVSSTPTPTPEPWPQQFHAVLFMNYSNQLSMIDLWYDWPAGRNFNIITDQLARPPLFDLEWNNGTSFFYTLQEPLACRSAHLEVGVLRPNWLDGAAYLGQATVDGFLCDAWTKADFIWYYQDVQTKRPVKWVFYTGRTAHVMTFEVGAVLEDAAWQAPLYCFQNSNDTTTKTSEQQLENQAEMFFLADPLTINQNLMLMFRQRQSSQSL